MRSTIIKNFVVIVLGLALISCSDESNETLSLPEEMHANERAITATAEYDRGDSRFGGPWGVKVFETETELLVRERQPASDTSGEPTGIAAERKAYFGDLHVHTAYSLDAFSMGALATPYDAYRYAKGEAIAHPAGFEMQLSRPLG